MRSGSNFRLPSRLVMVGGESNPDLLNPDLWDDAAVDSRESRAVMEAAEGAERIGTTIAIMVSISAACAATAVATGAYALWLSRHQVTRRTLTDVDDILRSCQSRMQELEADLQRQIPASGGREVK